MILGHCFGCKFHKIKGEKKPETSFCEKENCFSQNSDCVLAKALEEYLKKTEIKSIHIINKEKYGRS